MANKYSDFLMKIIIIVLADAYFVIVKNVTIT